MKKAGLNRKLTISAVALICVAAVVALFLRADKPARFTRPLRIGFGNEEPAHFLGQDGQATGYAVAVLTEAARRAGMELQWVHTLDPPDTAMATNQVDLWPSVAIVPERRGRMYISKPWQTVTYHVTSRKNNPIAIDHIPSSFTVAIRPSNVEKFVTLHNFPHATVIHVESRIDAFAAVCAGRADAVLTSQPFDEIKNRPECDNVPLQVSSLPDAFAYFGIGANIHSEERGALRMPCASK